jgi:hypothetical protein
MLRLRAREKLPPVREDGQRPRVQGNVASCACGRLGLAGDEFMTQEVH